MTTAQVAKRVDFGQQMRVYCQVCRLFCRHSADAEATCTRCATTYRLDEVTGEWRPS